MTDSSDKKEDIVYLYVNSFEYKDKKFYDLMGGHPNTGRLYRALYDKEKGLYRILIDDATASHYTGLLVKDLINDDTRWSSDIEILDEESILERNITAEDFSKLAKWKENNNADIDYLRIEKSDGITASPDNGVTKIVFSKTADKVDLLTAAQNNLEILNEVDKDLLAAITLATQGILAYLESASPTEPDLMKLVSLSRRNGKGANCGIAIEALTEYMHHDSYLSQGSLSKAVYYLLREIARINKEADE